MQSQQRWREAASVMSCYVNKVPFAILRSISDGDGGETDYQTFAEKAAHQSIEVVLEFIGRAEELK